jgi:hypothetical protein
MKLKVPKLVADLARRGRQFLTRVTDTRQRAVYVASCKGCGLPPLVTYFDDAQQACHFTCTNAECPDPHFTSNADVRSYEETRREWNLINGDPEGSGGDSSPALSGLGYVLIAREGQVTADAFIWSAEAITAMQAREPDRLFVKTVEGGLLELWALVQLPHGVEEVMSVSYDGRQLSPDEYGRLDDPTPFARSSRAAVQQSRATPPRPARPQTADRQSRRPFRKNDDGR